MAENLVGPVEAGLACFHPVANEEHQATENLLQMRKFAFAAIAVISGFFAWGFTASLGNSLLRAVLPEYAVVEKAMNFTLVMLFARLILGAVASVSAGVVCSAISGSSRVPSYALAAILLAVFVPVHVNLWDKFPIWYHLVFLGSLAPLTLLGTRLRRGSPVESLNSASAG